jgi:hypothetical protein
MNSTYIDPVKGVFDMNEVIQSLLNHCSVRKFQEKPVEPEVVDMILNTGIRAATAGNLQLYALIVVDDEKQKEAFGLAHAPLVIVASVGLYRLKCWFDISNTAPVCNNRANSLFLKSPARIMALIMIIGLALLIFALGERKLRQSLKQNNETIPDQKGKPTQTPTLRWVFQIFEGLDILSVWTNGSLVTRKVMNLRPVHQQIIRLLGPQIQKCYLIDM